MHTKQLNKIMNSPDAFIKFKTMGIVPELVTPQSPLITALQKINPRDRLAITGLVVDKKLGYSGVRVFQNAEQALRWCAPDAKILRNENWPAESWRIKQFKEVSLSDILRNAKSYPEKFKELI